MLHVKNLGNSYIILLLYGDNMLIVSACKQEIYKLKNESCNKFVVKALDVAKQILGIRITRDNIVLKLSEEESEKDFKQVQD